MPDNPYHAIERPRPGTIGWRIHYYREVGSTQDVAGRLAASGAEHGTAVIAETQSAGRGRMGRRWHSPPGANLYTTIILRPKIALAEGPAESGRRRRRGRSARERRTRHGGAQMAQRRMAQPQEGRRNDRGSSERCRSNPRLRAAGDRTQPESGRGRAARRPSGARDFGLDRNRPRCDRPALAAALFSALNNRYMEFEARGFEAVRPVWESYSALTGMKVTVVNGDARETGVVRGIDSSGALMLDTAGGPRRILAGDVTLEGAYD